MDTRPLFPPPTWPGYKAMSVYKLSVFQLTVGGGGLEIVAVVLGDRGLLLGVWPLERL